MKFKILLLALTIFSAASFPANASPVQMKGEKGSYTVDFQAGTYYGCAKGNSCISLGPEKKVGRSTWQNGNYTYEITEEGVVISKDGKIIFSDYIPRD
jgi:hypothetical protein